MLIDTIKATQLLSRKLKETDKASLLTTIIGESEMAGKNAGNRAPTDSEVIQVLKKFEKNQIENIALYNKNMKPENVAATDLLKFKSEFELNIIRKFLPSKILDLEVQKDIAVIMENMSLLKEQKSLGIITKELKVKYGDSFDGQQISSLFKEMLK